MKIFAEEFNKLDESTIDYLSERYVDEYDIYNACRSLYLIAYKSECLSVKNICVELAYSSNDIDNFKYDFKTLIQDSEINTREDKEKVFDIIVKLHTYSATTEELRGKAKRYYDCSKKSNISTYIHSNEVNSVPKELLEKLKSDILD